jgi:hypothetical protein
VTPEELSTWLEEKKTFFLIHTLTGIYFQKVHLPGALNACVFADLSFTTTIAHIDNNALVAEAHFDIDRTRWNVIYGSTRFFENLGMHLVFDLISFQVRIVAKN